MLENRENFYYEEDEMNLYDIIDILLKYKKLIVSIFLLGFILSFGAALGLRNYNRKEIAKQEFKLNYSVIELNPYYQMIGLSYLKFDPRVVLSSEKHIDKFLEIPKLKEIFEKTKIENDNFVTDEKIKFISDILQVKEDKGKYTITAIIDKKLGISKEIVEMYFSILEEEIPGKIKGLIETEKGYASKSNSEVTEKLENIKTEIAEVLKNERSTNLTASDMSSLIAFKEPCLAADNTFYQSVYDTTSKQILGAENILNSNLLDNIIEKTSSIVISNKSGLAKYILLGGIALTFFIIFMIVIIKEFVEGYKIYKIEKKEPKKLK